MVAEWKIIDNKKIGGIVGNSTTMDKRTNLGSDIATDQPFPHPVWIGHPAKFGPFRPHKDRT